MKIDFNKIMMAFFVSQTKEVKKILFKNGLFLCRIERKKRMCEM